jgi:hypothetical protein
MDEEVLLVIRRWIEKAEHDLTTASVVLEIKPDVTDTVWPKRPSPSSSSGWRTRGAL